MILWPLRKQWHTSGSANSIVALVVAIEQRSEGIAKLLLQHGANPDVSLAGGGSLISLVQQDAGEDFSIAEILRRYQTVPDVGETVKASATRSTRDAAGVKGRRPSWRSVRVATSAARSVRDE